MIRSDFTNIIYLSERLQTDSRFSIAFTRLTDILNQHQVPYEFLKATKDIWCRDYMPIQISQNRFVQFRYEPSYLKRELHLQSDPKTVCKENGIYPKFSGINLDGGNVVSWSDKAILTDRVFDENPEFTSKAKLVSAIEHLLEAEVIIIPQIKSDYTGHADGYVRFVDGNTILGNDRAQELKYWKKGIDQVLKENHIEYIDVPFFEYRIKKYPSNAIGCYVNFLEVSNLIVLPIFEVDGNQDNEVYDLFRQVYPNKTIETINFNEVGFFGGLLNCTTWTILE